MPSKIDQNAAQLRRRHYIRHATAPNHWFDFMESKVNAYRIKFANEFCFVINGSHRDDDAYIIPFSVAKNTFTRAALDERHRWIGTIQGTRLRLTPSGASLNVAPYHNAFHLIGL